MRRILLLGFGLVRLPPRALALPAGRPARLHSEVSPARRLADIVLAADSRLIAGTVPSGRTLGAMLSAFELREPDRQSLVSAIQRVFDVRRLRVGQPFKSGSPVRRPCPQLRVRDRRRSTLARRVRSPPPVTQRRSSRSTRTSRSMRSKGASRSETPSLTQALDEVGERIDLALQMADIFSGELDFSSELQPGDSFRLVVERQTREGVFVGYGSILAAEFVASGRPLRAYRYATAGARAAYYDEDGRSLKRFFLKSPLKFEPRITSRFSTSRRHPILGYDRAHNGVDYSAPTARRSCRWPRAR